MRLLLLVATLVAAGARAAAADGPCSAPNALAATVDRPGLGRTPATSGSGCVVAPHDVLVELGYRNQTTSGNGASSNLVSYPLAVVRLGIGTGNELVVLPPASTRRSGLVAGAFTPAIGTGDLGIGIKHQLAANAQLQSAISFLVTVPSGLPGSNGFSAGAPTYAATYALALPLTPALGMAFNATLTAGAAANASGATQRFVSSNPALTLSLALGPATTLLAQESVVTPSAPGAGTSARGFVALQHAVGRRLVVDVEREANVLPRPGTRSLALGFGLAYLVGP